jgi:hypothetical protein
MKKKHEMKEMPQENIHAIARLHARPDKTEELNALLASLLEPTREETGCIRFELWQNRESPTEFAIVSTCMMSRLSNITSERATPSGRSPGWPTYWLLRWISVSTMPYGGKLLTNVAYLKTRLPVQHFASMPPNILATETSTR